MLIPILDQDRMLMDIDEKLTKLQSALREMQSVLVAYSGGVDSAFLLKVARDTLGDRALGAIADSPSLPRTELREALDTAAAIGSPVVTVETHEVERAEYQANGPDRCFHCKDELFHRLLPLARARGLKTVAYGANTDDLRDVRPGAKAARQHGVRAPLVEADLSKDEIRELAHRMKLPVWDKPAFACLSSRVPFGSTVTVETLGRIEAAEDVLRDLGFRQFRVRHHDAVARVELDPDEISRALDAAVRERLVTGLRAAGYTYVTLDLAGYRTGSMHEANRRIALRPV